MKVLKVLFIVLACLLPVLAVVAMMSYKPNPIDNKYIFCEDTMYVYLDKSLNEEDTRNTKKALKELDEILVNYSIQFVDQVPYTEHYVYVEKVDLPQDTIGFCSYAYPKRVQIDERLSTRYWEEDGASCFGKVIQHEFGHVLGLVDLYEEEYSTKSVMYYVYNSNHGKCAHRYTDYDIENIKRIY